MSNPWVALDLHVKGGHLYFSCENAAAPESPPRDGRAAAPKYGYGLMIMQRTVDKYGGIMDAVRLPERFRLVLALPLNPTRSGAELDDGRARQGRW